MTHSDEPGKIRGRKADRALTLLVWVCNNLDPAKFTRKEIVEGYGLGSSEDPGLPPSEAYTDNDLALLAQHGYIKLGEDEKSYRVTEAGTAAAAAQAE